MEYEKKYKDALEKARQLCLYPTTKPFINDLQNLFQELKESEDERIRKEIIATIHFYYGEPLEDEAKEMVAWLEKQGDKKTTDKVEPFGKYEGLTDFERTLADICIGWIGEEPGWKEYIKDNADVLLKIAIEKFNSVQDASFKQKPTDEVESKFKVGDWIIRNNEYTGVPIQVIEFKGYYRCELNGEVVTLTLNDVHNNFHLWTIQDAKDGDMLASNRSIFIFSQEYIAGKPEAHCGIMNGLFLAKPEGCWTNEECYPATKEQCDTLETAMTDAGYTFDFEKKELKKIGQSEVTKTSDQEEIAEIPFGAKDSELQEATYYIPKGFYAEIDNDKVVIKKGNKEDESWFKEIELMCLNFSNDTDYREEFFTWLKSLKQRIGWKPSDEQIMCLQDALSDYHRRGYKAETLETLLKQLKQL